MSDRSPVRLGVLLYPGFDSLDALGPFQVFTLLGPSVVEPVLISETGTETSFEGVTVETKETFATVPPGDLDVIFVPGSDGDHTADALCNATYLDYVRGQAAAIQARFADNPSGPHLVTSVCTGSLLLAAAGCLDGYVATTHWLFTGILHMFPRVEVASGYPRYVVDKNVVTGGGISSGLDEALAIASILGGNAAAKSVQLVMQYQPQPPFSSGDPTVAQPRVVQQVSAGAASSYRRLKANARAVLEGRPCPPVGDE